MEAKCECERSGVISSVCSCNQSQQRCACAVDPRQINTNRVSSSASYWAHAVNVNKLATSVNSERRFSDTNESIFKDMASWRHPAAACLSPCISMRRLNRTYSEHRMRCLLTTVIAFCLGISVGALLPFLFPSAEIFPLPHTADAVLPQPIVNTKGGFHQAQQQKWIAPKVHLAPIPSLSLIKGLETGPSYSSVSFVDNTLNSLPQDIPVVEKRVSTSGGVPVSDGIFWSDWVERLLPPGFSDQQVSTWRSVVGNSTVTTVESGCGRMQNRLITYQNGKRACCRYRQNFDQIQGEIFSFYLSQLLGIKNLAPSTMDVIDSKSGKWNNVQPDLEAAQWVDDRPVVLTQFVNNLSPAFIPELLRSYTRRVHPPDVSSLLQNTQSDQVNSSDKQPLENIRELAQWSDLIVFDYLTANLDRMVNNLYNLQWNPAMMEAPAHNLAKDTSTGLLVFLDNESGLLHGYRLLDKYEHYHRLMLDSLCVFRKSTVEAIQRLHAYGNIQPLFKSMLSQFTKSQLLPMIPEKSIKVLNQRIETVHRQIQKCQSLYSKDTSGGDETSNNINNSSFK